MTPALTVPMTTAAATHDIDFLRVRDMAQEARSAVTTQSGESHGHGNSTRGIFGSTRQKIKLGGNIMKVDIVPRIVSNGHTSGASRRKRRVSTAAIAATITRKSATNDSPLLKAR